MHKKYPHLFSPIEIGGLALKNRIECAPTVSMDQYPAMGNILVPYYAQRAAGGAALVTIGESRVMPSGLERGAYSIFDPTCPALIGKVAEAIHGGGALASLEITHEGGGAAAEPLSPSAVRNPFTGELRREMTEDEILRVIDSFGSAALNVKKAGCDMLMLHAGHGWLVAQFLSPLSNHRSDRWGGSAENRARFLSMIIEDVRQKCGAGFPIELRISGMELSQGGITPEDCVRFCKLLDGRVDLFHISIGSIFDNRLGGRTICSPSYFEPQGRNVFLAAEIKKHVKTPVATIGSITDVDMMEEIIASGKADIVAAARTFIADPELPLKAMQGRAGEIRPCIRCLKCLDDVDDPAVEHGVLRCAVNPVVGREDIYGKMDKAAEKRRVLVVGGGAAGMQAAVTAAQRGHSVTLCEKNAELGGGMRGAAAVPFKAELEQYRLWLERSAHRAGVEVRLNTEVDEEYIQALSPDAVICAIGAESLVPDVEGADLANVLCVSELPDRIESVGNAVAVIGGAASGCEAAIYLAMTGRRAVVLEAWDDVLPAASCVKEYMTQNMKKHGVAYLPQTRAAKITAAGVRTVSSSGEKSFVAADTVVIAAGKRPRDTRRLSAAYRSFAAVGDCERAGSLKDATASAFAAAMSI